MAGETDLSQDDDAGDGFPDETHPPSKQVIGCLLAIAIQPLLLPIVIYFGSRGDEERGWLIVGLLGTFTLILYQHRNNYRRPYFAAAAPALFLAQFLGALIIPLPDWHIHGRAIMPFVIVMLLANVSVLRLFEWLWDRREPHEGSVDTSI